MMLPETARFLDEALSDPSAPWDADGLIRLASLLPPSPVFGTHRSIVVADVNRIWASWFLGGVLDPARVAGLGTYAAVYRQVEPVVKELDGRAHVDDEAELTDKITRLLLKASDNLPQRRRGFSRDEEEAALIAAGPTPRCWICGYKFPGWALARLTRVPAGAPKVEQLVDYMKPRTVPRHYSVEIDHVQPIAGGGTNQNNLRLACGWCNAYKSNRVYLYEVGRSTVPLVHPRLGQISRPHPFWVVRILASRGRCGERGCDRTTSNAELTIAPWSTHGLMTPANMRVTCFDHDPVKVDRSVPVSLFPRRKKAGAAAAGA